MNTTATLWVLLIFIILLFKNSEFFEVNSLTEHMTSCSDHEMLIINTNQCVSRCPMICQNGACFENGTCPCDGAYLGSCRTGLICAADCVPGCKAAGGYCASKTLCLCKKGFIFDETERLCKLVTHFRDKCRGRCLYGKCNHNGQCICAEGYSNSTTLFGQYCRPLCSVDCGQKAYCFLPNMCACRHKHHHYGPDGKCHHDIFY